MIAAFVIIALILLNALYVAGEFAAVSTRRTRVQQMAESGNRAARWMLAMLDRPGGLDRYVAACQIGITLSSLLLGAYGQIALTPGIASLIERYSDTGSAAALGTAAIVVLVGLTSTQVVLGELIPKSVALQFPTPVALYTSLPMRASLWIFHPLIAVLNGSGLAILRLLRAPSSGHRHIHSPSEIALLVAQSREGGMLTSAEQERFERALRLSVLPVRRIMVPRVDIVSLDADATLQEARERLSTSEFTRLPVYRGNPDQVIGVIHARDVARELVRGHQGLALREIMRPIATVPESMRCERLVAELRRQRSEQAIVVDEHGDVAGLVTLEDVLAEVLGEPPRTAGEQPAAEVLTDGRVRLPGRMRIDAAAEWLGVPLDGSSDTLSGLIVERLGHIPDPGERTSIAGVEVEVESTADFVVTSLIVTPVAARAAEERTRA